MFKDESYSTKAMLVQIPIQIPYLRMLESRKHSWMESQRGATAGEASISPGCLRRELPRGFLAK